MDIQLKTGCFDDAALVRRVVFMDTIAVPEVLPNEREADNDTQS